MNVIRLTQLDYNNTQFPKSLLGSLFLNTLHFCSSCVSPHSGEKVSNTQWPRWPHQGSPRFASLLGGKMGQELRVAEMCRYHVTVTCIGLIWINIMQAWRQRSGNRAKCSYCRLGITFLLLFLVLSSEKKLKLLQEVKEMGIIFCSHKILTARNCLRVTCLGQHFKLELLQDNKGNS